MAGRAPLARVKEVLEAGFADLYDAFAEMVSSCMSLPFAKQNKNKLCMCAACAYWPADNC